MTEVLGLIATGQTPRPDLEEVFNRYVPGVTIKMVGALDDVPREQIDLLYDSNACPLLCRLGDGTTCEVSPVSMHPYIEHAAHRLVEQGAQVVVVLCTGSFSTIACSVPVLLPGRVLPALVRGISQTQHVAVVTSVEGQVPFARAKWEEAGFRADVTYASPFLLENTQNAITTLQDSQAEMVILDCFGHDAAYKQVFVDAMKRPVLLAQTLMARIVAEFLTSKCQN